jgi:hypothetical protein
MAVCWCEIASLKPKHQVKIFLDAFDLLLSDNDNELRILVAENIARCYLCLAKSYARCNELTALALKSSEFALRFFLNNTPNDPALLEDEFDGCWDLIVSLYQTKSSECEHLMNKISNSFVLDEDGSRVPTKEELYEMWKPSEEHPALTDDEIVAILATTREQLQQQLRSSTKCYALRGTKRRFGCITSK